MKVNAADVEGIFAEVELPEFAARFSLASNLTTFLRIAATIPLVERLAEELDSPEVLDAVVRRIDALVHQPVDANYEHSLDTAIAVYLWLLNRACEQAAEQSARAVADCEQCWWARRIANTILAAEK